MWILSKEQGGFVFAFVAWDFLDTGYHMQSSAGRVWPVREFPQFSRPDKVILSVEVIFLSPHCARVALLLFLRTWSLFASANFLTVLTFSEFSAAPLGHYRHFFPLRYTWNSS